MPPKPPVQVKGQSSLFSFFKKPAADAVAGSPSAPASSSAPKTLEVAAVTPNTPAPTYVITDIDVEPKKAAPVHDLSVDAASSPVVKRKIIPAAVNKRPKTVINDDDDDEFDEHAAVAPPKKSAKQEVEEDEEAEAGLSDTDEGSASEASFTESESEEESDDLADSSEDEDAPRRAKKRPAPKKAAAAPPPAKKATPTKSDAALPPRPKPLTSAAASSSTPNLMTTPMKGGFLKASTPSKMLVTPDSRAGADSPSSFASGESPGGASSTLPEGVLEQGQHEHNFFAHLLPDKRKDRKGRPASHPDYDARTLQVPESFLRDQTPAMAQWWQLKAAHMDTVLFFKVGKFYEMFHMDADVGFSELDLIYMKGPKAHSGFPEIAYGKFCNTLVQRGYRVARVEQTETPEMLKDRNDSAGKGKKDKVVARELCSVMSKGTRTYCHLDDLSLLDSAEGSQLSSSVLVCIKETRAAAAVAAEDSAVGGQGDGDDDDDDALPEYGVCVVDSVIGTITLAQFVDDKQRSRLRTMLARYAPSEVLLEAGQHSAKTAGVVRLMAPRASVDLLKSGTEMRDARGSLLMLQDGLYFGKAYNAPVAYPPVLQAVVDGLSSSDAVAGSDLVMMALGGAVWQLCRSIIDYEILSLGKFFAYIPPDEASASSSSSQAAAEGATVLTPSSVFAGVQAEHLDLSHNRDDAMDVVEEDGEQQQTTSESSTHNWDGPRSMTLDEVALTNLEVLTNNFDRTETGSLWAFLNKCKTAFGRRLLRSWLCHPLFRVADIKRRRDAVDELLVGHSAQTSQLRTILKDIPDLERLLVRVHSIGISRKGIDHPDSRAVMYEMGAYNARKIRDFADVLAGFESVVKVGRLFESVPLKSSLLHICLKSRQVSRQGKFPLAEMAKLLAHFREIFDEKQAKRDGNIKPRAGIDPVYDQAKEEVAQLERDFEEYLREMKRQTGINDIKYFGSNKDRYQLEVPIGSSSRVPKDWSTKSQKKTHRRYWTSTIEKKLQQLMSAEDRLAAAQGDTLRRIFEKFDSSRAVWSEAVSCISLLDALQSLATISSLPNYHWPEVVPRGAGGPQLRIEGGRHPMLEFALSQRGDGDYIPNDVSLGGLSRFSQAEYVPKMLLLSGPNMGGKSTLLRQTCLITILAQLGCKVPAARCLMTPVDRIFTRVGASDRILAGQSTFFVELAETATILNAATQDSLCILDELGRGTATFDGTAIAHAVVDHLVRSTRCRALFATHYHSLVDDWEIDPRVRLGHMDCIVDASNEKHSEEVTFLYKLCDGSSPRSYGINVARLAGLPAGVVELAVRQSREFEERMKAKVVHAAVSNADDISNTQLAVGIADVLNRDKLASFYDRLVSIANSSIPLEELVYLAKEMWQRHQSI